MKRLDLDSFAELMNYFVTEQEFNLLIELPSGTQEAAVTGTGVAALDFFILLRAVTTTFVNMLRDEELEGDEPAKILDALCALLKEDCLEALKEAEDDES